MLAHCKKQWKNISIKQWIMIERNLRCIYRWTWRHDVFKQAVECVSIRTGIALTTRGLTVFSPFGAGFKVDSKAEVSNSTTRSVSCHYHSPGGCGIRMKYDDHASART
ncbi:Beta-galactosidase [Trichinella pseudospiralis]